VVLGAQVPHGLEGALVALVLRHGGHVGFFQLRAHTAQGMDKLPQNSQLPSKSVSGAVG